MRTSTSPPAAFDRYLTRRTTTRLRCWVNHTSTTRTPLPYHHHTQRPTQCRPPASPLSRARLSSSVSIRWRAGLCRIDHTIGAASSYRDLRSPCLPVSRPPATQPIRLCSHCTTTALIVAHHRMHKFAPPPRSPGSFGRLGQEEGKLTHQEAQHLRASDPLTGHAPACPPPLCPYMLIHALSSRLHRPASRPPRRPTPPSSTSSA